MGDAREEARRRESRSMEETKGRNPDLRPRTSDDITDRRHEMDRRTWAEKRGQIPYLRPRESDVRTDRRHEKDSRSWAEKRENDNSNLRVNESYHKESYANRPQQQRLRDVQVHSQAKIIRDPRDRDPRQRCQDISQRQDWVLDIEKKYNKSLRQICDVIVAGIRQDMMREQRQAQVYLQERRQRENSERQRREAQENAQQRRQRETSEKKMREAQENEQQSRQRETSEKERREAQENAQKQRLMTVNQTKEILVNHKDNRQGHRQRENIEWQTREALENVQEHTQRGIEMENRVAEDCVEVQLSKNLEEQIQRDTEKLKRDAEESFEEQRLKANTIPDSQMHERVEEIISQMIDETVEGYKRERMYQAKTIPESRGLERFKDTSQIHDEIVAGYIQAKMEKRSVNGQENLAEQRNGNIEMQSTEAEESVDEQR